MGRTGLVGCDAFGNCMTDKARRPWLVEGGYDQGLEGIHVSMDAWSSDHRLIHRREDGVWVVDANVFAALQAHELGESAEAWLATLL